MIDKRERTKSIMYRAFLIWLLALTAFLPAMADDDISQDLVRCVVHNGDTMPYVQLKPIYCFGPLKFKNKRQEKFYWRTVRDVKKTLPYAKIISIEYQRVEKDLANIKTERERKKYLNEFEKDLLRKYKPALSNFSAKQGQMLMKLVDRECHITSYELIKLYRGKIAAGFWQGLAKLFGNDLKEEYDGKDKDQIVERVIILVENGQL